MDIATRWSVCRLIVGDKGTPATVAFIGHLRAALAGLGVELAGVLTDIGPEFTGRAFTGHLAEGIVHHRIPPRSPNHTAVCKRFHGTVLQEFYRPFFSPRRPMFGYLNAWPLPTLTASTPLPRQVLAPGSRRPGSPNLRSGRASTFRCEDPVFLPRRYERDAVPLMGEQDGQAVINDQLVREAAVVIGLFHLRLGGKTPRASSGTVEELEQVAKAGGYVHVYFSKARVDPSQIDTRQKRAP